MLQAGAPQLAEMLWKTDSELFRILRSSHTIEEAREGLFLHLNSIERSLYKINSKRELKHLHPLEKNNAKHCARVLKNLIRTEYEGVSGASALRELFLLSCGKNPAASSGFLCEMAALFSGLYGKSRIYSGPHPEFLKLEGRKAALMRSEFLERYSTDMEKHFSKYGSGFDGAIIRERAASKKRIMHFFGASEKSWNDYAWHIRHAISDLKTLKKLVKLTREEERGIALAEKYGIPFQITPYYLSLFLSPNPLKKGRAIRAQVLPSAKYCRGCMQAKRSGASLDFMEEGSTSPIRCITRRYPKILILKPYDSCPQICVYCQRNWEIKRLCDAKVQKAPLLRALRWIRKNRNISEVLITGGDPLTLSDSFLDWIIGAVAKMPHIRRIRIGTRTLVTVPFRITPRLVRILSKYHVPGKRELCIVTHVEHPTELTPETLAACTRIRKAGISIYNQQVFTYFNSKRFETCALRRELKLFGIDPYYSFNTKGKEETNDFRVPIARIEQERKEEARLLPGIERTDEPVFNVPRLGKSHLRAWQDHELIMVLPDGRRVYRFYPWESMLESVPPYDYTDVSIYDYLKRLMKDGENLEEYKTIWYYF
ncbi:KamA family radical SAM protein [Candidatus Micrarchaeota archaeon CG1_02_47_40]|nr:MAG: KamA family radical SAM protein [Candidatus Micrarchaeota archaeon CG1_02_47_40]